MPPSAYLSALQSRELTKSINVLESIMTFANRLRYEADTIIANYPSNPGPAKFVQRANLSLDVVRNGAFECRWGASCECGASVKTASGSDRTRIVDANPCVR